MKNSILFIALTFFFPLFIVGCDDNNGTKSTVLTENDFAADSTLKANPKKGVVVTFLEHPDSGIPENDTGVIGIDVIPYKYSQTIEQTFCWEDDDVDAMHFMELKDSEGNDVVRLDVNGECVTKIIETGNYVMNIYLDGTIEDSRPIFIIPHPEDLKQSRKSNGLFNRFKFAVLNIIEEIQNNAIKNAEAQSVQENIETLLKTNSCVGCNLRDANLAGVNLAGANLTGADLSLALLNQADLTDAGLSRAHLASAFLRNTNLTNANLEFAILIDAKLNDANLTGAFLGGAIMEFAILMDTNLRSADLAGAVLNRAHMQRTDLMDANLTDVDLTWAVMDDAVLELADLTGARLRNANLTNADLRNANLTNANLGFAVLRNANLTGANLTGALLGGAALQGAIWCDMCRCAHPSIGTCDGCPPVEEVCTGS